MFNRNILQVDNCLSLADILISNNVIVWYKFRIPNVVTIAILLDEECDIKLYFTLCNQSSSHQQIDVFYQVLYIMYSYILSLWNSRLNSLRLDLLLLLRHILKYICKLWLWEFCELFKIKTDELKVHEKVYCMPLKFSILFVYAYWQIII